MEAIKIRALKNADLFRVIDMLKAAAQKSGSKLTSIMTASAGTEGGDSSSKEEVVAQVGLMVLGELYEVLRDELSAWYADLAGIAPDAFLDLPVNSIMDITEQLVEGENARFFSRAWQLYSRTKGLRVKLTGK